MELTISGNSLKAFARSMTCLARIGNELAIQASSSQLAFCTINSSRSAYQSITLKPDFFDVYIVSGSQVQCSVLLKDVCAVLRTQIASIDTLCMHLEGPDASKLRWTLECLNGMKKTYGITCNVDPDIQHLSLNRGRFPSNFVVRPRDVSRLLSNFQSSLQEITIIATEPSSMPSDAANEIGGKAVEFRSYIDPTKDNDSTLYTQLWVDPMEEFVQYSHTGNPVDITFGVKELKAFLSFCEACEVDIQLFFEKAGEPILMAPKFDMDDGSTSNFDATLVLATMLISQLHDGHPMTSSDAAVLHGQADQGSGSTAQQEKSKVNTSKNPSDHTRIWSDLSGSAGKNASNSGSKQGQREPNATSNGQRELQRFSTMQISKAAVAAENMHGFPNSSLHIETNQAGTQGFTVGHGLSQRHPSNWVDVDEDDDDDGKEENELCVESTPPYCEEP